ncbi:hypothetical protein NMG60_11004800 [Bertholletia excelsa]
MKRVGFSFEGVTSAGHAKKNASKSFRYGVERGSQGLRTFGRSLKTNVSQAAFPEDLKVSEKKIFDPQDKSLLFWNRLFVASCVIALSLDPFFLYLPVFNFDSNCLGMDTKLAHDISTWRTVVDAFFLIRMGFRFRTAYIKPSSRVFGRGELVIDPAKIARRYLHHYFIVDLLAVLPLPQIVVWRFARNPHANILTTKEALLIIVIIQYFPRCFRLVPLTSDIKKSAGAFAETSWAGAVNYLLWFILAGHIVGAFWYLLAVERIDMCWRQSCLGSGLHCELRYLYCQEGMLKEMSHDWATLGGVYLDSNCSAFDDNPPFPYGIYAQALSTGVAGSQHLQSKFFYCLWWGLRRLSTLGQGLETSTIPSESLFSIAVAIFGLFLFAVLIGNMQSYLQSLNVRLEATRIKRRDSEQWMHHRLLPQELREQVRRYDMYKWHETRGVDEESLVQNLPKYLRRDIKRHLCLNLVRRVPLFANMDDRLLDAICERLKPRLYTENTYVLREGDPVNEMLFIIRGLLESVTTDGGRSGFFNRTFLKEGDFCGEELLTWVLDPKLGSNLPPSTRTVKSIKEVEGFALIADEMKFISSQFRRLHSRQVQHTFRLYSHQWRTWASSYIQAAWRRYSRRKRAELRQSEEFEDYEEEEEEEPLGDDEEEEDEDEDDDDEGEESKLIKRNAKSSSFGATIYVSRFAANALRGIHRTRSSSSRGGLVKLQKPPEPDFGADATD